MLGRRDRRLSFADLDGWEQQIPSGSIYAQIRGWVGEHYKDDDFAAWFGSTGRPSKPPTVVLALTLLQFRDGTSDRQAVDNARFDDRWKFALGLSRSPEVTLDHSTLTRYRGRLLDTDFGRRLLRETLTEASEAGLLGDAEDLIDSFMVAGAAARRGTLILMHQAIRRVLVECEATGVQDLGPSLRRSDYGEARKLPIEWGSAQARSDLLQDLVHDGRALVTYWQAETRSLADSLRQAVDLLHLIIEQDIEPDPDHPDRVRIAQKVAPDRILSAVDPDMRHGRKTSSQKFDGYKAHVAVQNAPAGEGQFVTAVVVTGGNVADGAATVAVLGDREANTGHQPLVLMGDTAYGGMSTRKAVAEQGYTVRLEAPVPPGGNRSGYFSKSDFIPDADYHTLTCPNGQVASIPPIPPDKTKVIVKFSKSLCLACPLRAQCVNGTGGRSVTMDEDDPARRAERQRQDDPAWQEHYRERSRVEHGNARITRNGGRHSRYWGQKKVEFQLRIVAAIQNIEEYVRIRQRRARVAN